MFKSENLDAGSKNIVFEVKEDRKTRKNIFLFYQNKIQIRLADERWETMHVKMFTDSWLKSKMLDQIGYSFVLV